MKRGFWITRSLRPAKSSAFSMARRLLVTWRKPFSQKAKPDQLLVRQLGQKLLPERPIQQRIGLLALAEARTAD